MYDICNESVTSVSVNPHFVTGVFMDGTNIYWYTNSSDNTGIYRTFTNGTSPEIIALAGIGTIDEISVDWITANIYFLDTLYDRIGVCTKSSTHCTSIIAGHELGGFALYPENGEIYWSNWGPNPRIFRAEMNGKARATIVATDLGWPKGLTIDHCTRKIYWMDGKKWGIESMKLDGSDRRLVFSVDATHLSALAVFNNRLFWSDRRTKSISYLDEPNGQTKTLLKEVGEINAMHIYHPVVRHDYHNPCKNKPCDEICLLTADHNYTCACSSDNKILANDGKTCTQIKYMNDPYLIIAAGGNLYNYYHEILGKPHWKRIRNSKKFSRMYNSIEPNLSSDDKLIIYEQFSSFLNGTFQGIEYDYIGHNLYMVKSQFKRIEVMSLTTLKNISMQFEKHTPRSILLIPDLSTMIVTLCNKTACVVDKMGMTEDKWNEFIKEPFRNPSLGVPLAFDAKRQRVFWVDEMKGKIKSRSIVSDEDGDNVEVDGLKNPVSVAIIEDDIFWTLRNSKRIFWGRTKMDTITRTGFDIEIPGDVDVMHLITQSTKYYRRKDPLPDHKCRINNGQCSHVCLVETLVSSVCRCPPDMNLDPPLYTTCKRW